MPQEQDDLIDGFETIEGGMNGSINPLNIQPNQYGKGINVQCRGGKLRNRPGINRTLLNFDTNSTKNLFSAASMAKPQGMKFYAPTPDAACMIVCAGGRQFKFIPTMGGGNIYEITILNNSNSARQDFAYMCQAAQYFIIQDNQSAAIIYDGTLARRAGIQEVPYGSVMAFGLGFLCVARGNKIFVGDPDGGTTPVTSFTQTTYFAGGGSFLLPINMGNIQGMLFNAQQDTATGQGSLLVFGPRGVISLNLLIPRAQWQGAQIQNVTLVDNGTIAPRSPIIVNGDVIFRDHDGIRSLRDARAEQYGWGRTPISREVQDDFLAFDTPSLVQYTSATSFDNRLLMTCWPTQYLGAAIFNGIISLDYAPVANNNQKSPAGYDGMWTGINPVVLETGIFNGEERCFALCVHGGEIQIWEITKNQKTDWQNNPITSSIDMKATGFNDPKQVKSIIDADIFVSEALGDVDFNLYYKSDYCHTFFPWGKQNLCCPTQTLVLNNSGGPPPAMQPLDFPGLSFGAPRITDNDLSAGKSAICGYVFQPRLEWTGYAEVNKFLIKAKAGGRMALQPPPPL